MPGRGLVEFERAERGQPGHRDRSARAKRTRAWVSGWDAVARLTGPYRSAMAMRLASRSGQATGGGPGWGRRRASRPVRSETRSQLASAEIGYQNHNGGTDDPRWDDLL